MIETTRRRIPALDGIRGLAILAVLAHHAGVFPSGWVGVDMFFVLSGYLITGILVRAKERAHYYRNFLARRVLRIFPAYYAYVAVVLVVLPWFWRHAAPLHQWPVWTYLSNVAVAAGGAEGSRLAPPYTLHLWTVAVEEQFYLLWPAVVLVSSVAQLRRVCLWGIALALAFRIAFVLSGVDGAASYILMPTRMDSLLLGAWLGVVPTPSRAFVRASSAAIVVAIGALALLPRFGGVMNTIGLSVIALAAAGVLVASRTRTGERLFSWAPLRMAGRYSYSAYLGHVIVIDQIASRFALAGWLLAGASIAVTFALAALSWHLFEAPILSLTRFFPEPHVSPAVVSQPVAASTTRVDGYPARGDRRSPLGDPELVTTGERPPL